MDYSQSAHWLSIPATVFQADVFYLYPTTAWTNNNSRSLICTIDDSLMMTGAASAYSRQATAFETVANVYPPSTGKITLRRTAGYKLSQTYPPCIKMF
ncbi:MAG: DUF3089 domain-containing protein [Bacteroidia bacterium]|nr:DUF3089 domain-containing protein [Bacteroidia bacterium]